MNHCEICLENEGRYTCPKCGAKTCSLDCVKKHKVQGDCDGVIDNTTFIKRKEFKANELLVQRDYNFLMNLDRNINVAKTDIRTTNKRILTPNYRGQNKRRQGEVSDNAIIRRGVNVKLLPKGMERSNNNKSSWDKKNNTFVWTIEFSYVNNETGIEESKYTGYRIAENVKVGDILPEKIKEVLNDDDWFIFLKKIDTKATDLQFIQLNKENLLADELRDRTVIEFPTLIISKSEQVKGYTEYESDVDSPNSSDSSDSSEESSSEDEEPAEESAKKDEKEDNRTKIDPLPTYLPEPSTE